MVGRGGAPKTPRLCMAMHLAATCPRQYSPLFIKGRDDNQEVQGEGEGLRNGLMEGDREPKALLIPPRREEKMTNMELNYIKA